MAKTLVYHVDPNSTPDGLRGITRFIPYFAALGVDYLWIGPIYPSPRQDYGYDVANYRDIDRRFGGFHDFAQLIATADEYGIGILMDWPINHTSTKHKWFSVHPEFYCWSEQNRPGWHNLFDGGSAWKYCEEENKYYLHLFHESQADLNWILPDGEVNETLVYKFQKSASFWRNHGVAGFRLDVPQAINKDFSRNTLEFNDLIYGDQALKVINALFPNTDSVDKPFLIMEGFDPKFGELSEYYTKNSSVDFFINVLLKDQIDQGSTRFRTSFRRTLEHAGAMLEFESHDSCRMPSRGISARTAISYLFDAKAKGACLYQGQELGLHNPSEEELPDSLMYQLDVQTAMRFIKGEDIDELRPRSRANARIPIPEEEYRRQAKDKHSCLNFTRQYIQRWKQLP